ncbi:class I SAM-dependent methyltransferase [Chloroflexota bacterium]
MGDESEYIKLAELPSSGRLLDIGGGTGRIASSFTGLVDQVTNVDITIEMLKVANDKGIPSICSQGESLPFQDDLFSRILIIDSLHHINQQEQVIADAMRVLSPDGLLLIVEPSFDHITGLMIRIFEKVLFMKSNFLKDDSIVKMLSKHTKNVKLYHRNGSSWLVARKTI